MVSKQYKAFQEAGPPDLETILKKWLGWRGWNQSGRKSQAFKSSGGDQGAGGSQDSSQGFFSPKFVLAFLALFLMATFYKGIFIVPEGNQGLVLRLGAYHRVVGSGLRFIVPWLEDCSLVNTEKIDSISVPRGQSPLMLTNDENLVQVDIKVQYQMADPYRFIFGSIDPIRTFIQVAESAVRQVVGRSPLDDILTEKRSAIQAAIETELKRTLEYYDIGIQVLSVNLQSAKAPEAVKDAFDDVIKAREDQERYINEAQTDSEKIKAEALGKSQRIISEAEAYHNEVLAEARGSIDKFKRLLPEYQRSPEATKTRLYLETMEQIFKRAKKVIVDVPSNANAAGTVFYLPLDTKRNHFKP